MKILQIGFQLDMFCIYFNNMQQKSEAVDSPHFVILLGYSPEGSGSSVFVNTLAKEWKKLGFKVTIICQQRNAKDSHFVDSFLAGSPNPDTPKLLPGQLRVCVPIQAMSEFEGKETKAVHEMTDQQIEAYVSKTANCLKAVIGHDKVEKVLVNHIVLSPVIAARVLDGSIPYEIKIHGSDVAFNLASYRNLDKWVIPGLKQATRIYAGTEYIKGEILQIFKDYEEELKLKEKFQILNPGVDLQKFNIPASLEESEKQFIKRTEKMIAKNHPGRKEHRIQFPEDITPDKLHELFLQESTKYNQRTIDADVLQRWTPFHENEPAVLYIGAFTEVKGIGQLLAIAPTLILQKPSLKFIICGFGDYREHMSQLLYSFEDGDIERAKLIAKAGNFITEYEVENFFFQADKKIINRITILGYCDHYLLSKVLPLCTICVVPSKSAQVFGMPAVESMAAGVLPICSNHSGLAELLDLIEREFPELASIIRVDKEEFFKCLPQLILNLVKYSEMYPEGPHKLKERVREISVNNFNWSKIAKKLSEK